MKRLLLLLGILCIALPAYSQGSRVGDDRPVQSVQTPAGPIFSVPNATINICNNPANGVPCTNKANTYTDITLATQCPTSTQVVLAGTSNCVGTSDQYGNWGAWVPSGTYSYTITIPNGNSIGPFILTASSGSGSSILPTNNTFTGTNNFTNGIFISGNIVAATTGSFTIGDCVGVQSTTPLLFNDAGTCGTGGSGAVVASPQYQLFAQPNSGTSATAKGLGGITTDSTGNNLNVAGNNAVSGTQTVAGNVTDNANVAIKGPRPYIDVTAYGADPTGSTDSTTAFQSMITAMCAGGSAGFVPPGIYKVTQTQSSNNPIFTIPSGCAGAGNGFYIFGLGSKGQGGAFVPQARITVTHGASPGLGPVFQLNNSILANGVGSARIANLNLSCYNQCVEGSSGGDFWLDNDAMQVTNTGAGVCAIAGCVTDNAPLAFYGGLEVYIHGGTYQCPAAPCTLPSIVVSTDSSNHSMGLMDIRWNVFFGQILVNALTNPSSGWGTITIDSNIFEALANSPVAVRNITGTGASFNTIKIDNNDVADSAPANTPFLSLNGSNFYSGVHMSNNTPATGGAQIQVLNDSVSSIGLCQVFAASSSNKGVIGAGGNPLQGCTMDEQNGLAFTGPSSYNPNQGYYATWAPAFQAGGLPIQMGVTGENNTRVALDPLMGFLSGPGGTIGGYDLSLRRSAPQTLGVFVALADPPTVITATTTTGGSLTIGAHSYGVTSAVGTLNCNTITNYWLTASATTTSGNQSIIVGWTLPANTTNVTGYCVIRDPNTTAAVTAIFVSGATATTYTDTGTGGSIISGPVINNTFPASPQYTLGPAGTGGTVGFGGGGINPPVGDIGGTTGSPTVVGLEGIALPTLGGSTGIFYDLAGVLSLTTSASVLTTGTLPHAQLPALVSGDIPNNAANTSGNAATATTATALAGTPTLCTTGQAPTGILSSGNATGCASIASGLTTQTNGTNNISQSTLNLINSAAFNGLTFTFTNTGTGTVQAGFSGTLGNAGLTNPSTTINGVTATLGSTASLPFSVIGSNDTSQVGINFIASTVNALGLVVTPSNPSSNNVKFEITGPSFGTVTHTTGSLGGGQQVYGSGATTSDIITVGGTLEASFSSGADICAKIGAAFTTLAATYNGGTVTVYGATGSQACASTPFGSYPANFNGNLVFGPNIQVQMSSAWALPSNLHIDGLSEHSVQSPVASAMGAVLQAATGFPTNTPLVTIGTSSTAQNTSITNIRITCETTAGVAIVGCEPLQSQGGQENSRIENVFLDGGDAFGLDVSTSNAQQGGVYKNITIGMNGVNNASSQCFRIGTNAASILIANSVFENISCSGGSNATEPTILGTVDAASVTIIGMHMEQGVTGLLIGSQKTSHAINVFGSQCSGTSGKPVTNCFQISSANASDGINFEGDYALSTANVTNLLVDSLTNGGTIPVATESSIGVYSRGKNNTILSTSNVIPSQLVVPVLGSYTVAGLPAGAYTNAIAVVTNGNTSSDCTVGGGTSRVFCQLVSGTWTALGGSGGGGGSPGGSTYATQYNAGGGTFGGVNSPSTNGVYNVIYNVTGSAPLAPSVSLGGVPVNTQSSATPSITQANDVQMVQTTNSTTSTATAVPAGSTLSASFAYVLCNTGTVVNTVTPTTSTINGNATIVLQGKPSGGNPSCYGSFMDSSNNYWAWESLPTDANGRLAAAGFPALTGDVTNSSGSLATTVSAINNTAFAGTSGHLVSFGAANIPADSGVVAANVVTQTSNATTNQICTYTGANKICVPGTANIAMGGTAATSAAAGQVPNSSSTTAAAWTSAVTLGASGTLGSVTMGNATSGLLTLQPATGALGTVTVSIPAATDTLVNLAGTQTLTNKSISLAQINSGLTSGGVVCATSTTAISMTAALTSNVLPKGGGAGACPTNSSVTDNATTVTTTDTGGYVAPVFVANGTTAGFFDFAQGSTSAAVAPCNVATSICWQAPTAVTSYLTTLPGAAPDIASYKQTDGCAAAACTETFHPVPVLLTVASDFTDSTSTSLQLITGLSTTLPVSKAVIVSFHCGILFDQATAVVSDQFGIGVTGTAPTQANAGGEVFITASTVTAGTLTALASTTPTSVVTFTPGVATTIYRAELDGTIEQPSNATPGVLGIYVATTTGTDNIIVKRGSYCSVIYQ